MKTFITEDFLLQTDFAKTLYHSHAKDLPVIDYHCHLSPEDIANNHQFKTLTEIWLKGDHYKWRAMRTLGVDEKFITGTASDDEKFKQWAHTVPYTVRNPLYHWTHLELQRYFDVQELLSPETAASVYKICTEKLNSPEYRTVNLLQKMKVEVICTTDDPADTLEHHKKIATQSIEIKVLPTFRPDKAFAVENPKGYAEYLKKLSAASGVTIDSFTNLLAALENRINYFHTLGCKLSDHGLEQLYFPARGGFVQSAEYIQEVK
jgi:glucuronate isomerase